MQQTLRAELDSNGLKSVRIVAADGGWGIANDILKSTSLANAVDFIGWVNQFSFIYIPLSSNIHM